MNAPLALLNQLSPEQFLAEYWHKKPLLIRQAIPDFNGFLTPNELAGLACESDIRARIIQEEQGTWQVKDGPFEDKDFIKLPEKNWSLLVQNVNHFLPEAAKLLDQFNFIPHARLDDLMVSYAPKGGSVGAHVDSYDVFLLQGSGTRRWKINEQPNLSLVENAPIKLLQHFEATQEWTLAPGDMLYLPPNIAHHGISEDDECMTYSIGFRAPKIQELVHAFLEYLQDTIQVEGMYEDSNLNIQKHPAEISNAMIERVETMLQNIAWDKSSVSSFLGLYLTEPKPTVIFDPPQKISLESFAQKLAQEPLWLDLKSRMLFHQSHFYLNGEQLDIPTELFNAVQHLANNRFLDTIALENAKQQALAGSLYEAWLAGYIHF